MSSNITQYSNSQYAQGLVLAQLPELAGKISELLAQEKDTLLKMSKLSMDASVNAAGKVLMSSLAQAGSSLAGAAAGGANGITGGTALKSMIAENSTYTGKLAKINPPLEATSNKTPTIQLMPEPGIQEIPPSPLKEGQHAIGIATVPNHAEIKTEEAVGKEELKRQRKQLYQDHKQDQDVLSRKHDNQKSWNQLLQYGPEVLLQPGKGTQDKDLEQERGKQNLSGQAATQAETAKEQTVSTLTSLIQQTDVQGYASGMTR